MNSCQQNVVKACFALGMVYISPYFFLCSDVFPCVDNLTTKLHDFFLQNSL